MLSRQNIAMSVLIVLATIGVCLLLDSCTIEQTNSDETDLIRIETKADLIREHNRLYRNLEKRIERGMGWDTTRMYREAQIQILSELRLLMEGD